MAMGSETYSKGDWIVHIHYGVGQVKGIEKKALNGDRVSYYKVLTKNSTFWIPVDQIDCDRLRPIATTRELNEALKILKKPPQEMDSDHNKRKRLIKKIKYDGSLIAMARLVRDLWARRRIKKKLNATEERALDRFQDRLITEWSVCKNIEIEEAQKKLHTMLQKQAA